MCPRLVLILLKSPPFPQKFSYFPPMKRFLSSRQDSIYASTEFTSFRSHFWVIISAGKGPHFTQRWVPIGSPFWNVLAQPSPYLADPLPNAPTVLTRVDQNSKKFSKSHGLLIYFVPTWVKAISAKKMIFFAFSWLGHHVEKNGPCSRENEVKISKNRFLAIKSCRNMLQPSS